MSRQRNKGGGKRRKSYSKAYRNKLQNFPHPEEKAIDEKVPISDEERQIDEEIAAMEHLYGPHAHTPFIGLPMKLMNSRWPTE